MQAEDPPQQQGGAIGGQQNFQVPPAASMTYSEMMDSPLSTGIHDIHCVDHVATNYSV